MKFAFYISGRSGRLIKFLEQANEDIINKIKLVFSDEIIEENTRNIIESYAINIFEVSYEKLPNESIEEKRNELSDLMLNELKKFSIDYCFSFGEHILSGELLTEYRNRIINFHPAILPMFPGVNAIDKAKEYKNVLLVGNTAHFIDEGIDSGPIIMQSVTMMNEFLKSHDYDVVLDQQIPMLNNIITALINYDLTIENNRVFIKNADYAVQQIYPIYENKKD